MTNLKFRSEQELIAYINNPANYKQAQKKEYQVWCCMPPVGTSVHNKLEDIDYRTDENARFVLSGTRGEQWVIKVDKLAQKYTFADGSPITPDTLRKRQAADGTIDWFKVQTRPDSSKVWVCFVPLAYEFPFQTSWGTMMCNRKGVPHGLGDFIVRSDLNSPDGYICNGAVFADTYDNRGFSDYIVHSNSGATIRLPKPKTVVMDTQLGNVKNITYTLTRRFQRDGFRIETGTTLNTTGRSIHDAQAGLVQEFTCYPGWWDGLEGFYQVSHFLLNLDKFGYRRIVSGAPFLSYRDDSLCTQLNIGDGFLLFTLALEKPQPCLNMFMVCESLGVMDTELGDISWNNLRKCAKDKNYLKQTLMLLKKTFTEIMLDHGVRPAK